MKVYEFKDHKTFVEEARRLHKEGVLLETYSYLPEDELIEALNIKTPWVSRAAITGALAGAGGGFLLQYLPNVWGYSMNVSGKPLNSWPAFLLITFELGVLTCAFAIVGSFIFTNRFPRYDKEIFALDAFNKKRHDHFFILAKKEVSDVKANASHDLVDSLS